MSLASEIVNIACRVKPDQATLVPEKRQELTTEGGLDVLKGFVHTSRAVHQLKKHKINVSLFIEPNKRQIKSACDCGAEIIELHTGSYANALTQKEKKISLAKLMDATVYAQSLGLEVNAGHGLDYANVGPIAKIPGIYELNIGYSIVCYSIFCGLEKAVRRMKKLIL